MKDKLLEEILQVIVTLDIDISESLRVSGKIDEILTEYMGEDAE